MSRLDMENHEFQDIYFKNNFYHFNDYMKLINQKIEIKVERNFLDKLFVFEHIPQTGGSIINDLLMKELKDKFYIPSYFELFEHEFQPKLYIENDLRYVLSSHYMNGVNISSKKPIRRFTFIREGRKILLSYFLQDTNFDNFKKFLSDFNHWLDYLLKKYKTLNFQTYEIAKKNHEKNFPFIQGGSTPHFHLPNFDGEDQAELFEIANTRLKSEFDLVGNTENFSESIYCLFKILNLPFIPLWSPGVYKPSKISIENLPNEILEKLTTLTEFDNELFSFSKRNIFSIIERFNVLDSTNIYKYVRMNNLPILKMFQDIESRIVKAKELFELKMTDESRLNLEINKADAIVKSIQTIINLNLNCFISYCSIWYRNISFFINV